MGIGVQRDGAVEHKTGCTGKRGWLDDWQNRAIFNIGYRRTKGYRRAVEPGIQLELIVENLDGCWARLGLGAVYGFWPLVKVTIAVQTRGCAAHLRPRSAG